MAAAVRLILTVWCQAATDPDTEESRCCDLLAVRNRFDEDTKDPEWALESREPLKTTLDAMR